MATRTSQRPLTKTELAQYPRSVAQEVEYPQIRYVVPPTRMDGIPTGQAPRMRHDLGCQHFEWPDGTALGEPKLATEEQMHSLRACKSCVKRRERSGSTGVEERARGPLWGALSQLRADAPTNRGVRLLRLIEPWRAAGSAVTFSLRCSSTRTRITRARP